MQESTAGPQCRPTTRVGKKKHRWATGSEQVNKHNKAGPCSENPTTRNNTRFKIPKRKASSSLFCSIYETHSNEHTGNWRITSANLQCLLHLNWLSHLNGLIHFNWLLNLNCCYTLIGCYTKVRTCHGNWTFLPNVNVLMNIEYLKLNIH